MNLDINGIKNASMFFVKKNWPTIATVGGCAGVIAGTVLACRGAMKVPAILEEHAFNMDEIDRYVEDEESEDLPPMEVREEEAKKEKAKTYASTALSLAKVFAPAIALEGTGIFLICSSHVEMGRRQAAISAAYSTLATSFETYRGRVRKLIGEDGERKAFFGADEETVEREEINPETGRKKKVKEQQLVIDLPTDYSLYARAFCKLAITPDGEQNIGSVEWKNDSASNLFFLKSQQNYANDLLHVRGWVSLNEVYEMLGFDRIPEGQVIGWVDNPEHTKMIDFGIYNMNVRSNQLAVNQPAGYAPAIMLDFNIDPKSMYDQELFFRS